MFPIFFSLTLLLIQSQLSFCQEVDVFEEDQTIGDVSAQTSAGLIPGKVHRIGRAGRDNTVDIDVFFGVPYAEPPIGELRFEKTKALSEDNNRLVNASEMPPVCVPHHRLDNWTWDWDQYSEDCLYLNVFAPHQEEKGKGNDTKVLYPMLVIAYSGGFETQSMRRYKDYMDIGWKYVSRGIVVVAVQFRIGYFGFTSLGDEHLPGNFGYWDLKEALAWISKNGQAFGGNPKRMTLFGYSSGSSAITTLGISPHTRDYFQQSIQMSGSVFTGRAASSRVVEVTKKLASLLGCEGKSAEGVKRCLKGKSIEQFMEAMDKIGPTLPDLNYDLFGPVIDFDFLPADFPELINQSEPNRTILGVTEMDPLGFTLINGNNSLRHLAIPHTEFESFNLEKFREYLRLKVIKEEFFGEKTERVMEEVVNFYTNGNGPEKPLRVDNWFYLEQVVNVLTDLQFVMPLVLEVRAKKDWPLFLYVNKYVNPTRFKNTDLPDRLHKNFHDNDHNYVFRHPYSNFTYDGKDVQMVSYMVNFLANFIISGDPSSGAIHWPTPNTNQPFQHLEIDLPKPLAREGIDLRRVEFWDGMIAKYPEYNLILGRRAEEKPNPEPEGNFAQSGRNTSLIMLICSIVFHITLTQYSHKIHK